MTSSIDQDQGLGASAASPPTVAFVPNGIEPFGLDQRLQSTGEHTPGPWQVSKQKARRVTNAHGVVICNAVLRNQGTAKGGHKHGAKDVLEGEANARLIAAAPELLEALTELWEYSQGLEGIIRDGVYKSEELKDPNAWSACDDWAYNGEGACMRDQVEAAIAKAVQS